MKKLHLICNSHIDPVWLWTYDEGISAAISTFKSACDLAEEFDYIFCHNESVLYEAIETNCPALFERIKKLVKLGKWKIMGGWYVQPDCLIPHGESFIRQIKVGQKYFKEKFGVTPEVATNFDSFGHSVGLVQILKKCGFIGYVSMRPFKSHMNFPDGKFYRWVGPSGDSVIYTNVKQYLSYYGKATVKIKDEAQTMDDVDGVLWGVGNHGGGPSRVDLRAIKELKLDGIHHFHSSFEDLFHDDIKISADISTSLIPAQPGCYSSMARIKQLHRETENMLYFTEKLISLAKLSGANLDTTSLYESQKRMLLAEFHDILPGTCIQDGEKNGLELLSTCLNTAKEYRTNAFMYLTMGEPVAKDGEYPIYVFNPMPYEVITPIETEFNLANQNWSVEKRFKPVVYQDGVIVPSQEIKEESTLNLDWRKRIIFNGKLKPLGITRFSVYTVEEPYYDAYGRPMQAVDFNEFLKDTIIGAPWSLKMYEDTPDPWAMSTEEHKNGVGKNPSPFVKMSDEKCKEFIVSDKPAFSEHLIEKGEIFTAIEGFYTKDNTDAVIEYRKYQREPFIDVKVTVEFGDKNKLVRLCIPIPDGEIVGDGPFVVESKNTDIEIPFQKWIGVKKKDGKILAFMNDGIHSARKEGNNLCLILLRGVGYSVHPLDVNQEDLSVGARTTYPINRYLPRIDSGRYTFKLRAMEGTLSEVCREAELFNQKTYAINVFPIGTGNNIPKIYTDKPIDMPIFKVSEDGGYIFRFYNPEENAVEFTLFVNENSQKITLNKAEVVSVRYNDNKFTVYHEEMPV